MQNHSINADDELVFPMHKRVIVQYSKGSTGSQELHLYYGDKEISFNEPDLFDFGENLAKQSRFVAITATEWGKYYEWPRIQQLLEQLIEEGILQHANTCADISDSASSNICGSPLPPAFTSVPHTWLECEAITSVLLGRTLEISYLELVIPVFRVAHVAMDAEGRQLGEANVFPKPLRFEISTEWQTCPYSGSRYLDERPMNISSLKSMRTNWSQILLVIKELRTAYLQRFPLNQQGWTVGGLEVLSTVILALPTFLMMRNRKRVANGELHSALSSLFRATDGLRMVMHQMIFVPAGQSAMPANTPITSTEIFEYAERNHAFASEHGVCAGTKLMIEEFFDVLINGETHEHTGSVAMDPQLQSALDDLDPILDYGLYGMQAFVTVFSFWPLMARTYEQLLQIVDNWTSNGTDQFQKLSVHLQTQVNLLKTQTYHGQEEWRINSENAYSDLYQYCAIGLPEQKTLRRLLEPKMETRHDHAFKRLSTLLHQQCSAEKNPKNQDVEKLLKCLMNFFLQVQAILRVATDTQQSINGVLGRVPPLKAFDASNLNIHNLLQGDVENRPAFLIDVIEEIFNIRLSITKDSIEIIEINPINRLSKKKLKNF
jgi:hypothetical protein